MAQSFFFCSSIFELRCGSSLALHSAACNFGRRCSKATSWPPIAVEETATPDPAARAPQNHKERTKSVNDR
eukprot:4098378-Amphidinium_carterae.1